MIAYHLQWRFALLCSGVTLLAVAAVWGQGHSDLQEAEAAFRSGNLTQAQVLALQVLTQDPQNVQAHVILGVLAAQKNQWLKAGGHFETMIRLAPANPHGYFYLGQAFLYQQQWADAASYLQQALERGHPDRNRVLVQLALSQNEAGLPREALSTLEKVGLPLEGPLGAQFHAVVAFARAALHENDRAIEAIRRARDLDPANPQYWEFLISRMSQGNRLGMALAEAIEAQKRFPDHPGIQFQLGMAAYQFGRPELTRLALRNLREAEPEGTRTLVLQGVVHRERGEQDEALQIFSEAARRGVPDSRLFLGLVLRESGDLDGAEREFRETERASPENGQVHLELGKLLAQRGATTDAVAHLEKAARYLPAMPNVHYQLAMLYRRLGERGRAEKHLQAFRRLKAEADAALLQSPGGAPR